MWKRYITYMKVNSIMADILNFDAIPQSKRAEAKLNILYKVPNVDLLDYSLLPEDPNYGELKYTELQWINRIVWRFLKRLNKNGHELRMKELAGEAIDIENE